MEFFSSAITSRRGGVIELAQQLGGLIGGNSEVNRNFRLVSCSSGEKTEFLTRFFSSAVSYYELETLPMPSCRVLRMVYRYIIVAHVARLVRLF